MSKRKAASGAAGLPTREQILEFVRKQPGKVGKREIARAFGVASADKIGLKALLKEIVLEKQSLQESSLELKKHLMLFLQLG